MKQRTKAYAKRAAAVAKEMLIPVNHPWKQDVFHSPWKFRIFDLERGCRDLSRENETEKARDLLLDCENTRKKRRCGGEKPLHNTPRGFESENSRINGGIT